MRGIFTTVTPHFGRVAIQATPIRVLRVQAERLGLPLYEIPIPVSLLERRVRSGNESSS